MFPRLGLTLVSGVAVSLAATPFLAVAHEWVLEGFRKAPLQMLVMLPFLTPFGLPYSIPTGLIGGMWLCWRSPRARSRAALQRQVALGGAVLGVVVLWVLAALAPSQWHFETKRVLYFAAVCGAAAWLAPIVVERFVSDKTAA